MKESAVIGVVITAAGKDNAVIIPATGMVNSKTTAVRLIPAIDKTAGDKLSLGGLPGSCPVMAVNSASPLKFISGGGRSPAPLQSLKN